MSNDLDIQHGDARQLAKQLPAGSVDAIVSDPPYGEGLLDDGDESPVSASKLLGEVLAVCSPLLRPGAHVVLWWSSRSLDLCIEAAKGAGLVFSRLLTMYTPQGGARPYRGWLPRVQPILMFRAHGRYIPEWRQRHATALREALAARGMAVSALADKLGCSHRLATKWTREDDDSWSYPNSEHRAGIFEILGVRIPPAPEKESRPARHDIYQLTGGASESSHPCEKPLWVVEDIVSRIVQQGGLCLDPFCGSGTTLLACRRCGVRGIGFEIDDKYCKLANERLSQSELF